MSHNHFHAASLDLVAIAHDAMIEAGFEPDEPPQVAEEVKTTCGDKLCN